MCRADLWINEKYRARFPYFLECKKRQNIKIEQSHLDNWNVLEWFKEAERKVLVDPDYDKDSSVMVVFSKNHYPLYCLVKQTLDDRNTKTKFSFILTLPKNALYCYLFTEYIYIYKELNVLYDLMFKEQNDDQT